MVEKEITPQSIVTIDVSMKDDTVSCKCHGEPQHDNFMEAMMSAYMGLNGLLINSLLRGGVEPEQIIKDVPAFMLGSLKRTLDDMMTKTDCSCDCESDTCGCESGTCGCES